MATRSVRVPQGLTVRQRAVQESSSHTRYGLLGPVVSPTNRRVSTHESRLQNRLWVYDCTDKRLG